MTDEQTSKCHKIIHTAAVSAAAIATGLAQIPGSDAIPITTIQVGMIIGLGAVFGQEITKSAAKSILGGATAAIGGRTVSHSSLWDGYRESATLSTQQQLSQSQKR